MNELAGVNNMRFRIKGLVHRVMPAAAPQAFALIISVLWFSTSVSSAHAASCTGEALVNVTLPSGAQWELCWELRDEEGVVIKEAAYKTPQGSFRNVLKEASLAQINVAYDDGTPSQRHVTDIANGGGLGLNIHSLSPLDCIDGSLHASAGNTVLCVKTKPRGYAYKSYALLEQGHMLVLESRATVGLSSYIIHWRLYDDGSIEPSVGLTGLLPKIGSDPSYGWPLDQNNRVGVAFNTSYFWRLDFDLAADGSNESIEEFEVISSADRRTKSLSVTTLSSETSRSVAPDVKRSWRIRDVSTGVTNADGRSISYHLSPMHTAHRYTGAATESWAQDDIYFTRFNTCERFVVDNPTNEGCADNVSGFINGESIDDEDVVLWYKVNYHHLPRSEDEPAVQIHWDGFIIAPRDWTATNPLAALSQPDLNYSITSNNDSSGNTDSSNNKCVNARLPFCPELG